MIFADLSWTMSVKNNWKRDFHKEHKLQYIRFQVITPFLYDVITKKLTLTS